MKGDTRNFPLLYDDEVEIITGCTINEYVFKGSGAEFRLLLECLYATVNPPHTLPHAGGYLDQHPVFLDALRTFKNVENVYMQYKETQQQTLKSLGMTHGRSQS